MLGTVIAERFRLERELGVGTMGVVYEAVRVRNNMPVAVKILRPDLGDEITARFVREGKALAMFDHPNIVRFIEAGIDGDHQYLATELVRGVTLRELMDAGPIEPQRALSIMRQVLEALGHVHALGVVHRDLKPENIMLVDGGKPGEDADFIKMLDFGVAKLANDTAAVLAEMKLTRTGFEAFGTALYMAPEVALGRPVEARSDLYAAGAILFEMLAGRPPYDDQDVAVLMRMHATAKTPTLKHAAPDRSSTPELELVIAESLAKEPARRFKSAAEMIGAIDAASRSLEPLVMSQALPRAAVAAAVNPAANPVANPANPTANPNPNPNPNAGSIFEPYLEPTIKEPVAPSVQTVQPIPSASPRDGTLQMPPPAVRPMTKTPMGSPIQPKLPSTPPHVAQPLVATASSSTAKSKVLAYIKQLTPKAKRNIAIGAGAFAILVIVLIAVSGGDGKSTPGTAVAATVRTSVPRAAPTELANRGLDLIAAGNVTGAIEHLEAGLLGTPDDGEAHLALGHARTKLGHKTGAIAAYERAVRISGGIGKDSKLVANVTSIAEGKDAVAAVIALELAASIGLTDVIIAQASTNKILEVRHRAIAIAERDGYAHQVDRIEGWSQDLAQLAGCEMKRTIVAKLRSTDRRAIPALKKAKSIKCIEKDVAEALTFLETSPQ